MSFNRSSRAARLWRQPALETLEARTVPATLTVKSAVDGAAGSLRDAIAHSHTGDSIVFDRHLSGQTLTLTQGALEISNNLRITGLGASSLAISGNNASRIFNVDSGANLTLAKLTLTQGLADQGGAIDSQGTLTISDAVFSNNEALGDTAITGVGGAIFSEPGAVLLLTRDTFTGNQVVGGIGLGYGGGVFSEGTMTVNASTFSGNSSTGGSSSTGAGVGLGGAISSQNNANLTVTNSTFTGNVAYDGAGSYSDGGAIDSEGGTSLTISNSTFTNNEASATSYGYQSFTFGGAVLNAGGNMALSHCTFTGNEAYSNGFAVSGAVETQFGNATISSCTFTGNSAIGVDGASVGGAAIHDRSGTTVIKNSSFVGNTAIAGDNADGVFTVGEVNGGAIWNSTNGALSLINCDVENNMAQGGNNGNSLPLSGVGFALGGGVFSYNGASLTVSGGTFAGNQAIGGSPASGQGAEAIGGAIDSDTNTTLTVSNATFSGNEAVGGAGGANSPGGQGIGGAIVAQFSSTATLTHVTLEENAAIGGAGGVGGDGGTAVGGALIVGHAFDIPGATDTTSVTLNGVQILGNVAIGGNAGAGGNGGSAYGGGIIEGFLGASSTPTLTVSNSNIAGNGAFGGTGVIGGNGFGGGVYVAAGATAQFTNSAIFANLAIGGVGSTTAGLGEGGGIYVDPAATANGHHTTVDANLASTTGDDVFGTFGSN